MTSVLLRAAAWGAISLAETPLRAALWAVRKGAARASKTWLDFQLWLLAAYEVEEET